MQADDSNQTSSKTVDSELIGIVYEVAFDPGFWPGLLEGIAGLFEERQGASGTTSPDGKSEWIPNLSASIDMEESARLALLLPHLYRSLKLKRDYNLANHSRGQAQAIIEQFPVGVLFVTATGRLISANQQALDTIANSKVVWLQDGCLRISREEQNRQLAKVIAVAAGAAGEEAQEHVSSIKIHEDDEVLSVSLLVTPDPYPNTHYDRHIDNCAAIFISSCAGSRKVAESALHVLFDLTPAEARLAALLASGISLAEAAEQNRISKNTAKVQLKSIFSKTGVNRQAELVKLILTSPAVFSSLRCRQDKSGRMEKTGYLSRINRESSIRLRDGRRIQYAEYGDRNGKPVIHLHGILGCRYERLPDDEQTRKTGIRLIIPDRPGYGLSSQASKVGYLEFAADLGEFADRLELDRFSLMGLSVGAIYGSAFAYREPERVEKLVMISSTPPFRSFGDFAGVVPSLRLLIAFSRYLPTAARMICEIAISNACKDPDKFIDNIPASAADRKIFSDPCLKRHITDCLLAGSQGCHAGFVNDIMLSAQQWPFLMESLQVKVDFWHGTDDLHSPLQRIKPVMDRMKDYHLYLINGGGHFLIYDHWQAILQTLA